MEYQNAMKTEAMIVCLTQGFWYTHKNNPVNRNSKQMDETMHEIHNSRLYSWLFLLITTEHVTQSIKHSCYHVYTLGYYVKPKLSFKYMTCLCVFSYIKLAKYCRFIFDLDMRLYISRCIQNIESLTETFV